MTLRKPRRIVGCVWTQHQKIGGILNSIIVQPCSRFRTSLVSQMILGVGLFAALSQPPFTTWARSADVENRSSDAASGGTPSVKAAPQSLTVRSIVTGQRPDSSQGQCQVAAPEAGLYLWETEPRRFAQSLTALDRCVGFALLPPSSPAAQVGSVRVNSSTSSTRKSEEGFWEIWLSHFGIILNPPQNSGSRSAE